MQNGLYHYKLGLPQVKLPETVPLKYGSHAKSALNSDRYGLIKAPNALTLNACKVIEMELLNGRITKLVVRTKHCAKFDLVLVVNPDGFVRTVWLNSVADTHKSLDRSKYVPVQNIQKAA